jgi:MGT family glycosyltransferase
VARIALVNVPFYSHTGAMTRLAGVLVRQGHEVIVWAHDLSREQIEACGARFESHDPELPRVKGFRFAAGLAAATEQCAEPLIAQLHALDADLLVRDSQTPWALVAGDYLGIPRIVSHPMFPIVAPAPGSGGDRAPAEPGSDHQEEQARERFEASWLSIARRWGVEIEDLNGVFHSTAEITLTYTTEKIVGDHQLRQGWHCVGPLMAPPPPAQPRGARPLVYVCFGTSYNFRPELFRAVIGGLADQAFDVLISTGRGTVSGGALEPLPANVEVREFVSAREVLARASVHVTHGGCNSVHESLLAGVPMVCIPQAFDQSPLAQRVEQLGAGLLVNEDPVEIRDGVRLLVGSAKARSRARALSNHLAHYDGEARVAALIDSVLSGNAALAG